MKTSEFVSQLCTNIRQHAEPYATEDLVHAYKNPPRTGLTRVLQAQPAQRKLSAEKLNRMSSRVLDTLSPSVCHDAINNYLPHCFPELAKPLEQALLDRVALQKLNSKVLDANTIVEQATLQASGIVNAAEVDAAAIKKQSDALESRLAGLTDEATQLEAGINRAVEQVQSHLPKNTDILFTTGDGTHFIVSGGALARQPCYLSVMAVGHFKEKANANGYVKPIRNITPQDLQSVTRFLETGLIPDLNESNAAHLQVIAEEFGPVSMVEYIKRNRQQPGLAQGELAMIAQAPDPATAQALVDALQTLAEEAASQQEPGQPGIATSKDTLMTEAFICQHNAAHTWVPVRSINALQYAGRSLKEDPKNFTIATTLVRNRLISAGYTQVNIDAFIGRRSNGYQEMKSVRIEVDIEQAES